MQKLWYIKYWSFELSSCRLDFVMYTDHSLPTHTKYFILKGYFVLWLSDPYQFCMKDLLKLGSNFPKNPCTIHIRYKLVETTPVFLQMIAFSIEWNTPAHDRFVPWFLGPFSRIIPRILPPFRASRSRLKRSARLPLRQTVHRQTRIDLSPIVSTEMDTF